MSIAFFNYGLPPAFGRGRAVEGNSETERGLSEQSEFRSSRIFLHGAGNPQGRARAEMVFGTFAETKEPRRAGAKPRIKLTWIPDYGCRK